jgi:hypothetical protein
MQAQIDKLTTGEIAAVPFKMPNLPTAYIGCGFSLYLAADASKAKVDGASADIYATYAAEYDVATGKPVTPGDAAKVLLAEMYMSMLWKGTTKVAFGKVDKHVIIWYCTDKPAVKDAAKALLNIGAKCMVAGANKCFNDL